jgi:diguanylate cyclase
MSIAAIDQADAVAATASRALQLMAQHNAPATPRNFEMWFTFARGTSPELNKTINILIDNKRPLDGETHRHLFVTYIGQQKDWDATHVEISEQLRDVMSSAHEFLATAISDNRDHVRALGGVASQIQGDVDPRAIIQQLVGELSKAVRRAATLEASFGVSLRELDQIRNNLVTAEQRSKTDPLTGLANRVALDEFLRASQMAAMENGRPLAIFLVDIDHFKKFNDNFGHQTGDQVLRLISGILKGSMRSEDLAARFGGEELVAILPGADIHACTAVAEKVREMISRRQLTRRTTGEILSGLTVSIGAAQFVPGETLTNLFERCDRALYAAKHAGRNRTVTELDLVAAI